MKRMICVIVGAAALAVPLAAAAAPPQTVMSGLNNPRGLAFGPEGALYVAEAGSGGPGACVPLPDGPGTRCYGPTGAISRLWRGQQERIATGLPSVASQPAGDTAAGPQHISFQGRGGLFVTIGCSCNKSTPTGALLDRLGFGYLRHVSASGNSKALVDLAGYEASANPDGAQIDSNPFGLLALPGHRVATDAGGNSLLNVAANGHVSTIATFPRLQTPFPRDAVPTAVVLGPDGAYYVPTLTGFPFTAGNGGRLSRRPRPGTDGLRVEPDDVDRPGLRRGRLALRARARIGHPGRSLPVRGSRLAPEGAPGRRGILDPGRRRTAARHGSRHR